MVGLGEAVYQFTSLKSAVGSTGKAFSMFGDLAKGAVNYIAEAYVWLGNRIVGVFRGAFYAVKAIWSTLPAVLGALMVGAANAIIGTIELMITGINRLFNKFISGVNSAIGMLPERFGGGISIGLVPDASLPKLKNPWAEEAKDAGKTAAVAFNAALRQDIAKAPAIFDVPGIREQWKKIQDIIGEGQGTREASEALADLKAQLDGLGDTPGGGDETGVNAPAAAFEQMSDAARRAQSAVGTLRDGLAGVFSSVIRGADSARSAVAGLLDRLADMAAQNAFKALFNGAAGTGVSGGSPNLFGQIASFLFGGVPAFANGGLVPGGLTMVGERGPDLLNVPAGSRVFSAAETERMAQGGVSRVQLELSPDLEARILQAAAGQSVEITQSGLDQYDRAMPARVNQIASDPRYR